MKDLNNSNYITERAVNFGRRVGVNTANVQGERHIRSGMNNWKKKKAFDLGRRKRRKKEILLLRRWEHHTKLRALQGRKTQ